MLKRLKRLIRKIQRVLFIRFGVASEKDIDEINSVLKQAYSFGMEKYDFHFSHFDDFKDKLIDLQNDGGKTFVVRYGRKIIGTISVKPKHEERWYYTGDAIEICHFGVLPKYQKLGLGGDLLDKGTEYAFGKGLPVVLSTPEKNVAVIRLYEKKGFNKVRMFKAQDHYAVRFIKWCGEQPYTKDEIKTKFEKNALLTLMKHYEICNEVANKELRKRWNMEFYRYIKDQPPEIVDDMRRQFRKNGRTPKRYVRNMQK